jgi:broad specificity phosphatase PhoE
MKWPESLTLIRHDTSAYNALKVIKDRTPLYSDFKKAFDDSPESQETIGMALTLMGMLALNVGDHNTPLADGAGFQAKIVGEQLQHRIQLPHVIFVSPYLRTHQTLEKIMEGWPALRQIPVIEEERIREQDHGLALLYNDWRIFQTLHKEQRKLYELQGRYWYRYPQGENVPDVRERNRSWLGTLSRDYTGKRVFGIGHHLQILSTRCNLERLDAQEFLRLDDQEKPINVGVTIYQGDRSKGKDGKLILQEYNTQLYP